MGLLSISGCLLLPSVVSAVGEETLQTEENIVPEVVQEELFIKGGEVVGPSGLSVPSVDITDAEYIQGTVLNILEDGFREVFDQSLPYQKLQIRITKGSIKGKVITVENGGSPMAQTVLYEKGDDVMISYTKDLEGEDVFFITDYVRTPGLLYLFVFFAILSVVIGGRKGAFSIGAMIFSFAVIFIFILPQIQNGRDPVMISVLASFLIIPVTFYLSHGFEKKTTVSIAGTFIALVLTGLLSAIFVNSTHLSGMSSEDALLLQSAGSGGVNLKGLLLAGIIIGALGVLDDITVSQTAVVYQLHDLKPELPFTDLFARSLRIGRDHIASMINTLVLVYTGASLPLLLIFLNNPRPFGDILNLEMISTEIVRTLVGSIGLILAVPITTYLACYFVKKRLAM